MSGQRAAATANSVDESSVTDTAEVARRRADPDRGLRAAEAGQRLPRNGRNECAARRRWPTCKRVLAPYSSGPLDDTGKLLLRLTLGSLMLLHGISKVAGGIDFILGAVAKAGLPAAFGYLVESARSLRRGY